MHVAELPEIETAYDKVGVYNQDAVNGFSEQTLNAMLDFVDPARAANVLDAMAGNGNLTLRLYDYCARRGIPVPNAVLLELASVQCELAAMQLVHTPTQVIWGDILTMEACTSNQPVPKNFFDRVMMKSGNHEIPLEKQGDLYRSIFNALTPGGIFVNLGFLFDDIEERDQFRDIARVKDSLAGMHSAAQNRHFLTRDELYARLQQAGFVDIHCGMHVQYTIRSLIVAQAYFSEHGWQHIDAEFQAQQAKAMVLRRKGRIHFHGDSSIMLCPGEITIARRPV